MTSNGIQKITATFAQMDTTSSNFVAIILIQIEAQPAKVQCDIVLLS